MMSSEQRQFGDPWPAPTSIWGEPPWVMSGTSVTAWYETDVDYVRQLISPAFVPVIGPNGGIPTRSRYYTIDYVPRDVADADRERFSGRFIETVVAFKGFIADVPGEYSAYMWTDDERYRCWGRENFGWPLVPARFDFSGDFWRDGSGSGVSVIEDDALTMTLKVDDSTPEPLERGPAANWLTPRRILFPGSAERRDLLVVRAESIEPGEFTRRQGHLEIQAKPNSWANGLVPIGPVDIHAMVGFKIIVGHDVDTVSERSQ